MKKLFRKIVRKFHTERIIFREPAISRSTLPPVFILGAHRSGTTLMRLILDSHSRIAVPLESMFLMPLSQMWSDGLSLKGLSGMGFSEEHVKRKLKEFIDYYFDSYAQARGKVRWVDKCPHYVDCMDFIEDVYGPECRYIFIYRHGLDVACSVANMPIEPAEIHKIECGDPYVGGARYWAVQCEKLLSFQKQVGGRGITVHYENLVEDPDVTVRNVLRHIGEEWEDQVLSFYEYDHCQGPGLEDPKASWSKGFNKSSGNWLNLESDIVKRMVEEAGPTLVKLGYTFDHSPLEPLEKSREI